MKLYQLLWQLLKHALHGRWRDEVFVAIGKQGNAICTATVDGFTWEDDQDAMCAIHAEVSGEVASW